MKEVTIYPGSLAGEILIPPSKSICHRAVICAGLSDGVSIINNIGMSQDIKATCEAMRSLGMTVEKATSALWIKGSAALELKSNRINCRESGSTLRFVIPIAALTGEPVDFYGEGKLVERSLAPYFKIFREQGIEYRTDDGRLPLHIKGRLTPGEFQLEGNISSQFISGLMFALPLLEGDSRITVTNDLESKPYIDLTMKVLQEFSIHIENDAYRTFMIKGKQKYKAANYSVEGDYSQAAFWLAAGALGSEVACRGLDMGSAQGDKLVLDIICRMGGRIASEGDTVSSLPADIRGTVIDASQCPDLVPVLAVLGALSEGRTEIINAGRLRLKESDRLKAISSELGKLGAAITEEQEGLVIEGRKSLQGGGVDSWNDHRIAMALAIAATKCEAPVVISNASCVKKSYPDFWEHYRALGGRIDERNMG
ncbi:MAG TPA: 3-phosphoshikimate 1-carboxyvinyltransferase [Clostridia bacterium]|nr:3-phosphoshikimate 1-carboxyvinyltransferase [Clostridia bacterium]